MSSDPQAGSALQGRQPFGYHSHAAHVNAPDGSRSLGKLTFPLQGLDAGCGGRVQITGMAAVAAAGERLLGFENTLHLVL